MRGDLVVPARAPSPMRCSLSQQLSSGPAFQQRINRFRSHHLAWNKPDMHQASAGGSAKICNREQAATLILRVDVRPW